MDMVLRCLSPGPRNDVTDGFGGILSAYSRELRGMLVVECVRVFLRGELAMYHRFCISKASWFIFVEA